MMQSEALLDSVLTIFQSRTPFGSVLSQAGCGFTVLVCISVYFCPCLAAQLPSNLTVSEVAADGASDAYLCCIYCGLQILFDTIRDSVILISNSEGISARSNSTFILPSALH